VIEISRLEKTYILGSVQVPALIDINLGISSGEFCAIMGPSGSGKSTLMNLLGCLDRPTSGSYLINGEQVKDKSDDQLARIRNRFIGFVFQSFNLLPGLSARENVELPLIYRGEKPKERQKKALEVLEAVGLAKRVNHRPMELSGGEQQRVAIARALSGNPTLILADEPTGALDTKSGEEVIKLFSKLNEQGMTIILVTHDEDVAVHTRRIIRLRDGRLLSDEPNISTNVYGVSLIKGRTGAEHGGVC